MQENKKSKEIAGPLFCKTLAPTLVCSGQTQVSSCQNSDAAQDLCSTKTVIATVENRTLSEWTVKGCEATCLEDL